MKIQALKPDAENALITLANGSAATQFAHTRADPSQAWSAGTLPFMITEMLALTADGFDRQLRVCNAVLPPSVHWKSMTSGWPAHGHNYVSNNTATA